MLYLLSFLEPLHDLNQRENIAQSSCCFLFPQYIVLTQVQAPSIMLMQKSLDLEKMELLRTQCWAE